ncbi:MAG: threonylcarbamoyl-AMP synthase [Limnochordaceae bacterium]|nr:threonylcarbamoyl-AMP synthase [Limnochordaceae bacterium]
MGQELTGRFATKVLPVGAQVPPDERERVLQQAGELIRAGQLVAFPTETVYGLGADATNASATRQIFAVKGRPADNPLIVHIERWERLRQVAASLPPLAATLADAFWPGPLTMVMPRSPQIPLTTTGGLETVAVRLPSHPVARELIAAADCPIAAPSANRSGRPSPTRAQDVYEDMAGRIPLILDGGECSVGVESTVLDVTTSPPTVLRPGGITVEMLRRVLGEVQVDPAVLALQPVVGPARSPGMKYRHYAPKAPAWLFEGEPAAVTQAMAAEAKRRLDQGERLGLLVCAETAAALKEVLPARGDQLVWRVPGSRQHPEQLAHAIFTLLREMDREQVEAILIEGVPATGMGLAVMNRLRKAAGYQIVSCHRPAYNGA